VITLPPSCAECLEIWEPQPRGALRGYPALYFLPQRKHWVSITTIKMWRLFGESHVCSKNHTKPTNTLGEQNAIICVKATAIPSLTNRLLGVGSNFRGRFARPPNDHWGQYTCRRNWRYRSLLQVGVQERNGSVERRVVIAREYNTFRFWKPKR